ncbi:MAG: DUF3301 domain-containing protein [Pseudomonadales bacterium]|jgi:hypothetical protein|nr:DUF3301 domain-containing protein [Pseudomonadales bacterium]
MSLSLLFWATVVAAFISFWWRSDKIKHGALAHVSRYCKQQNLQLLDQTLVLRGVWLVRNEKGSLIFRRKYSFEFTSTGEVRYHGRVVLYGASLQRMDLEAYIIPDDDSIY